MKVGILTFHRAVNYGAVLQAFSLKQHLESLGCEVSIIDYAPEGMGDILFRLKGYSLKNQLIRFISNIVMIPIIPLKIFRRNKFRRFISMYLNLTHKVVRGSQISGYDYIIIGSDQVWNIYFTGGTFDEFYWGNFIHSGSKLFSYAASASENFEETFEKPECAKYLKNFSHIGVREEVLAKKISSFQLGILIRKVLDPTLLVNSSIFNLFFTQRPYHRKYLLVYQVLRPKNNVLLNLARRIAKEKGLEIVEIASYLSMNKSLLSKNYLKDKSPDQFVNLFYHADFVITTSFHGTAFSIIFKKDFLVYSIDNKTDERARELLSNVGLQDRMISSFNFYPKGQIDWLSVELKLDSLREESNLFIKEAMQEF